jgi:hypothetical protein
MSCVLTFTFEQNGCQSNAAFGTYNLIVLVSNWSASSKISISTCRPSQLAFCACAFHGRSAVHMRCSSRMHRTTRCWYCDEGKGREETRNTDPPSSSPSRDVVAKQSCFSLWSLQISRLWTSRISRHYNDSACDARPGNRGSIPRKYRRFTFRHIYQTGCGAQRVSYPPYTWGCFTLLQWPRFQALYRVKFNNAWSYSAIPHKPLGYGVF